MEEGEKLNNGKDRKCRKVATRHRQSLLIILNMSHEAVFKGGIGDGIELGGDLGEAGIGGG